MDESAIIRPNLRPTDSSETLSPREQELLTLAAEGLTDQGIAHRLGISIATVGTYWGRVRVKLGPYNRTELVSLNLKFQAQRVIDQLQNENRRLVGELQERVHSAELLETSLELFQGLVETAPDAIIVVDQDGMIQLANEQAAVLFGYEHGALRGMFVDYLLPERYREKHVDNRNEYAGRPVRRTMGEHLATYALRKDGTEFRMATALSSSRSRRGILVTCIIREMPNLSLA
jgi:PAS domain S-box-containing protein